MKQIIQSLWREYQKNRRSPEWNKLRKEHLKENNFCAICKSPFLLQVHHVVPFKENPELELDRNNLLTLCAHKCHLKIGHGGDYKFFNPKIRTHVLMMELKLLKIDDIYPAAKRERQPNDGN